MKASNDVKALVKRLGTIDNAISQEAADAITQLAKENAGKQCELDQLKTRCKEADSRAKPYGMDEWKGGEEARASYIERITALEKENAMLIENNNSATAVNEAQKEALGEIKMIATEQDRKLREQELKHRAEIDKLRNALGMFLFHPTAFNESVENARKVLGVEQDWSGYND